MSKNALTDREYTVGVLEQHCPTCSWFSNTHKAELQKCPQCGAALTEEIKLCFGGMTVIKLAGNRFTFQSRPIQVADFVYLDEADVPDTIIFLLKHNTFWYAPSSRSDPGARG